MAKSYTSIAWRSGDQALEVELFQTLTPEALETVLARARREFVAGCRQLGFGISDDDINEAHQR